MGGIRSKFILLLIVYFAGFATAIYTLTPVPDSENLSQSERGFAHSVLKSDEFAQKFNVHMHHCIDFIKEKGCQVGEFIKEKINEHREKNS
jgi:hypothetical protein